MKTEDRHYLVEQVRDPCKLSQTAIHQVQSELFWLANRNTCNHLLKSDLTKWCAPQSIFYCTVYPGSSDPLEKIFNIFASENEVYTIYELSR